MYFSYAGMRRKRKYAEINLKSKSSFEIDSCL